MHHNIANQDIYLPPITLNKPINSILGYNLPQPFPRTFPDQLIPSMFLENSLDIQNILLHGNSVKIPSFPQQCREDAQSATSSSEWIDTEERYPLDLSRLSQNMEKSALNRLFSPGNSEDFYIAEPMNIEYLKLLSQAQDGDFNRVLGLSKASKKIVKNSTNHDHINGIHDEKNTISIKNRPSLDASRKLRFNKLRTKRNPWRPSEDSKLLELVEVYGESWAMISSKLPNRTGKQIRDRYLNILRPNLKKGEWTLQEDALLMALSHKIGHKWSSIAKHMPGRSEAQVKNRFYSHIKKRLEGGKGVEEEVISIPRFEPSSAASFLAESTEIDGEGSRRWAEEENCGEASVKQEETEKKKIKEEHGWETKVEAEDMKMHTEHHKQPARKVLGERRLEENSVSERDNEWIGLELPQNSAEGPQRSQHRGKNVEHSVQKKVVSIEKCGQKIIEEGSNGMKVSPGKGQQKMGTMENVIESESKASETSRVNRRGPINEKEVDLVIGILARYYQNSDKREAQQDSNKMEMENAIMDKTKRLQQLDVRKANLELLLIKTMEEMDKIQQK